VTLRQPPAAPERNAQPAKRRSSTPQSCSREGIERRERLVEEQKIRLVDQGAAEVGALLHAAREPVGRMVGEAGEPDGREQDSSRCPLGQRAAPGHLLG
jgi:hypothetical protein